MEAEAKAIRWAVDNGARVINISLGGLRDPRRPSRDTYSRLEEEAIRYAVKRGAVVVAAVGNADQAPRSPWHFASYPAALPHVLGVSALTRSGGSPGFSNRDAVYNDVAAPGEDILSTFPALDHGVAPRLPGAGLHAVRVRRVPSARRHVVRRAAGHRRRCEPARRAAAAPSRAGDRDHRADGGRRDGVLGLPDVPARPRPVDGMGRPRRDGGDRRARRRRAAARRARAERQRRRGRVPALLRTGREGALRSCVGRLLGRPGRRLRDLPAARRAALHVARPRGAEQRRARPLAPGDGVRSRAWRRRTAASASRPVPARRQRLAWTGVQEGWHYLQARLTAPSHPPVAYRLSIVRTR